MLSTGKVILILKDRLDNIRNSQLVTLKINEGKIKKLESQIISFNAHPSCISLKSSQSVSLKEKNCKMDGIFNYGWCY